MPAAIKQMQRNINIKMIQRIRVEEDFSDIKLPFREEFCFLGTIINNSLESYHRLILYKQGGEYKPGSELMTKCL